MPTETKPPSKIDLPDFRSVQSFCLFIGYSRSGHSVVGALLDAHRDAMISHELHVLEMIEAGCKRHRLFGKIVITSRRQAELGRKSDSVYGGKYTYDVPNQHQGRCETLRVVGDKRGAGTTLALAESNQPLERLAEVAKVPIKLIHVVRNPYDNIATLLLKPRLKIESYFELTRINERIMRDCPAGADVLTVYHEDLVADPAMTMDRILGFLSLESDPAYLRDCAGVIYPNPSERRFEREWTRAEIDEIEAGIAEHEWLARYAGSVEPA